MIAYGNICYSMVLYGNACYHMVLYCTLCNLIVVGLVLRLAIGNGMHIFEEPRLTSFEQKIDYEFIGKK